MNTKSLILELKSYDQHLNMILGDVEETVTSVEIDEETYEEVYKVKLLLKKMNDCLFLFFNCKQLTYLANQTNHSHAIRERRRSDSSFTHE